MKANKLTTILTFTFFILTTSVNAADPTTDSTAILPVQSAAQSPVIIPVMHFTTTGTPTVYPATCPPNGSLVESGVFWGNGRHNNWFYFICAEKYWPTDTFYKNITNPSFLGDGNTWQSCANNPYYPTGAKPSTSEKCSYFEKKPPVIRVVLL